MISIVNWLVRGSSSFIASPRVIVNHTPSTRVIIVFDNICIWYYILKKHGIVLVGWGTEGRAGQLCSIETNGSPACGAENRGEQFSMHATMTGLFREQRPQEIQEEIQKAKDRIQAKTENMEEIPFTFQWNEKDSKGDRGGDTKGNGPKGTSPSGKPNTSLCYHFFKKGNAPRNPHVIIGTHQKCTHYKSKNECEWKDNCEFMHSGNSRWQEQT